MPVRLPREPQPNATWTWARRRRAVSRAIMKSHRMHIQLSQSGPPPLRIRPVFVALCAFTLVVLSLLGFHPTLSQRMLVNDKVLHFLCFAIATAFFYMIWEIEDDARRIWLWRHMTAFLTGFVCFIAGSIGSEFVQALLPYKNFQWGDVVANLLGSSVGLYAAANFERRHRRDRELRQLYRPMQDDGLDSESEDAHGPQTGGQMFGGGRSTVWSDAESIWSLEGDDGTELDTGGRRSLTATRQ